MEEHPNSLSRCEQCRSQVQARQINNRHYELEKCKQLEEMSLRRETLHRCFKASSFLFQINAYTLPPSEAFPYLGRTIAYNNINWSAVYLNLRKSKRRWVMIVRVLERTGATVRDRQEMYKVVA